MNVAIVTESIPYPADTGGKIRTLNLLLRLAAQHRITLLCRADVDPQVNRAAIRFCDHNGIRIRIVDDPVKAPSGLKLLGKLLASLASPLPFAVQTHNSPAMRAAITGLAATRSIDLWQFEWLAYADALGPHCRTPTILVAHNIESLIWERHYNVSSGKLRRWYLRWQWHKFERLEKRLFDSVSSVVTVSQTDAELATQRYDTKLISVVENGVDTVRFQPAPDRRDAKRILFLGSLDWRPNQDAVRLLLSDIFPRVLAAEPEATLSIVGRKPPLWLTRAARRHRNVEVHADVPDVLPFLSGCAVMAVPLRIGGGSRLKILEALACGVPVVSTTIGSEGLELSAEHEIDVVDEMPDFASALIRAIRNPQKALEKAEQGRRTVLRRYDWNIQADKLEQLWLALTNQLPAPDARFEPVLVR